MGQDNSTVSNSDSKTLQGPNGTKCSWNTSYKYEGSSKHVENVVTEIGRQNERHLQTALTAMAAIDSSSGQAPAYKSVMK